MSKTKRLIEILELTTEMGLTGSDATDYVSHEWERITGDKLDPETINTHLEKYRSARELLDFDNE